MTLSAIVNGVTYSLDDGTYCYWVGDDGLGMAPLHRLSERGPLKHGDTDRGYRLDARMVRLVLAIVATTRASLFSKRSSLMGIFSPVNTKVILQMALDAGTYRLDTHYVAQMAMPSSERLGWNQTVVVDLKANDPTWYKSTGDSYSFSVGAGADLMEVPTVIPMSVGGTTVSATVPVTYSGNFPAYPRIRINGPIVSCVITNNSTGEKLDFTGTTISAGTYYDIDCRYGHKTIVDNSGTNRISNLTSDSDLSTWSLVPAPTVLGGVNSITAFGLSANQDTSVDINWTERYLGV